MRNVLLVALLAFTFTFMFILVPAVSVQSQSVEGSNLEKVKKECDKQSETAANEAVKKTPMQHPGDASIIKQRAKENEFNKCMSLAGHTMGPVRAK